MIRHALRSASSARQLAWSTLFVAAAAGPAVAADGLDVKVGLWEMKVTTEQRGTPPMSESAKRDLTPEQRAKLAAALAKSAAAGPRAFTTKTCLRAEDLKKGTLRIGGDDDEAERCRYQVTVQTKTQQEATATCTGDPPRTSKIKAQSLDREHITGTIESTSGASQSTVRFTGRWVGTDCSGADDE